MKKFTWCLILLGLSAFTFAGCGGDTTEPITPPTTPPPAGADADVDAPTDPVDAPADPGGEE
jgi:hypothetical protein